MNKVKIGGVIQNATLATLCVLGIADRPGVAASVLNALGQEHVNIQFIVQLIDLNRQDHLCLCIDRTDLLRARPVADKAARSVGAQTVQVIEEASIISIFGPDFRERPGIAGTMFAALAAKGINILAISTSISTVSCVIEAKNLATAIEALQQTFELP